jgi:DNA-binding transcriptional MerR regulator
MNQKIEKLAREIEKTRARIADDQARLKDLEKQKTELENLEIVTLFRASDVPLGEIQALIRAYRESGGQLAVVPSPAARAFIQDTAHLETGGEEADTDE